MKGGKEPCRDQGKSMPGRGKGKSNSLRTKPKVQAAEKPWS